MKSRGFTIVELLIVIVVIAILAAITVVAFNGVQQRAKNTSIENGVAAYVKILNVYRESYGGYALPGTTNVGYCLGEVAAYPDGCYTASPSNQANATFATELKKAASPLPAPDPTCIPYGGSCRRNFSLARNTTATVNGNPHQYYIFYYLYGNATCSLPGALEGSWMAFSRTTSRGYFERNQGGTMCVVEVTDPA